MGLEHGTGAYRQLGVGVVDKKAYSENGSGEAARPRFTLHVLPINWSGRGQGPGARDACKVHELSRRTLGSPHMGLCGFVGISGIQVPTILLQFAVHTYLPARWAVELLWQFS